MRDLRITEAVFSIKKRTCVLPAFKQFGNFPRKNAKKLFNNDDDDDDDDHQHYHQ